MGGFSGISIVASTTPQLIGSIITMLIQTTTVLMQVVQMLEAVVILAVRMLLLATQRQHQHRRLVGSLLLHLDSYNLIRVWEPQPTHTLLKI